MGNDASFLAFAHIGDLHLSERDPGHAEALAAIVDALNDVGDALSFAFLPGDNADNGLPGQYAELRRALDRLRVPAHVITGDHDMEPGGLDNFYAGLGARPLPYGIDANGYRCLFLDMCGPGSGGPDFRLGAEQAAWLATEVRNAEAQGQDCIAFMHSYPDDLKGDGEAAAVAALLHRGPVRLVEMGHTHYNEVANDGRTIYAAARSTGQIEEGGPGFAIATLDGPVVSWRFRELAQPWPFVVVTSPADRRLAHDPAHVSGNAITVRALALGLEAGGCAASIDGGAWQPMRRLGETARWQAELAWPEGARTLSVRATRPDGSCDTDSIEPATRLEDIPVSRQIGSDRDSIGAWAGRGLLGTQLGPNRNGRHW